MNMRKLIVILLVLLLPVKLFSQEKHIVVVKNGANSEVKIRIGCDNNSAQSFNLTADFAFNDNDEELEMSLSYFSESANKYAGLWFPVESISYKDINKYFERNERGVAIGTIMTKQVKNGALENDMIQTAISLENALPNGSINFTKSFGNSKNDIDNQVFTLESGSILTTEFDVQHDADSVTIRLNNLIPFTISQGSSQFFKKYNLHYIANNVEIVVMIDRDGCVGHFEDIAYIDEMIAYYNKFDAHLAKSSTNCTDKHAFEKTKANVLSGYDGKMFDNLRDTQCERLKNRLDSLNNIISIIKGRKCTECDKYVTELQSNYGVLDSKYQYLYELYTIQPRTADVIERFNDGKIDANRYINNLDLKKYENVECSDVAKELQKVNKKIKQIKGLVVNRCDMTKSQADAIANEIRDAIKSINKNLNQYSVVNDIDKKKEVKEEIITELATTDEKISAMHADCIERFKYIKESVNAYNEEKKLCKSKGIIND